MARQPHLAAVQVQEDQPARRAAQVLYPGDRLLAAVAALLQMHRGVQPAQLVRDGAVVGLQAEPRPVRLDPQRLVREHPDGRPGLRGEVPRLARIRYSGFDALGQAIEREAEGFHARVVQHECDHLIGKLYPMRIRDWNRFGFTSVLFPELDPEQDD